MDGVRIGDYLMEKGPSIFTRRRGKEDVVIWHGGPENTWGFRQDKRYWQSVIWYAAEDRSVIQQHKALPDANTMRLFRECLGWDEQGE